MVPKARQLPSGAWRIQTMLNGKRMSKTFSTKKEAELWALSFKSINKKNSSKDSDYELMLKRILGKTVPENKRVELPTVENELNKIDSMEGIEFEIYCSSLLKLTGYFYGGTVYSTRGSGDFGADIVIECLDGTRVVIQCKRVKGNVGIDAIQEVYSSKPHYCANKAAVLTNSCFTPAAKELAKNTGVSLLDRKLLKKMLELYIQEMDRKINKSQWDLLIEALFQEKN